jgi:hypothetical protein
LVYVPTLWNYGGYTIIISFVELVCCNMMYFRNK